ncbi:DUF1848 domain-containing protein [Kamptonema cortianum]|nr:DUF1848 domain-containing protein [Geitlerinema splendidum]MDK3161184.1 DUF1848 domain-containing protein [Kamptonema cortianum]
MIISASYKTDIPAFYGQWFVNRLAAGYCLMRNPMNRRVIRVSLKKSDVDGIVFWTKNFRPFMKHVSEVESCGIPFSVQYTINGYPQSLENHVVDWRKSADTVLAVADRFGPHCVVWRYDTVILSSETPVDFHLENFSRIADALRGATNEVVISFLQLYRKTARNLDKMSRTAGNHWRDPSLEEKQELAAKLHTLAKEREIMLTICSQPEIQSIQSASRCIDSKRLAAIAGHPFSAKTRGNRPGCECSQSRDIGDYDTCPHGCVYCYAVRSHDLAVRRFRMHDPESEFLFTDTSDPLVEERRNDLQLRLFDGE